MIYNKLIRDKIPEIIRNKNLTPVVHTANDEEYREKLECKLKEEVSEYLDNHNPEELVDVLEVIYAICSLERISIEELETIREKKREERGGFEKRIILKEVKE
jgi:predicted house-cleaning noncanonical NTP pyrophosphatase (MazG superfamily)